MKIQPDRLHAFEVKYMPDTNTRGSRVKVKSGYWHDEKGVTFGFYKYDASNTRDIGIEYLQEQGYTVVAYAETSQGYVILCREWIKLSDAIEGKRQNIETGVIA